MTSTLSTGRGATQGSKKLGVAKPVHKGSAGGVLECALLFDSLGEHEQGRTYGNEAAEQRLRQRESILEGIATRSFVSLCAGNGGDAP